MIANAQREMASLRREVTNLNATALNEVANMHANTIKDVANMRTYTTSAHRCQIPVDQTCEQPEPPETLDLADEADVTEPFWRHCVVEPTDDRIARWAILHAYENGAIGAVEAFYALDARALFGDLDDFMTAYCAGIRALEDGRA